MNFQRETLEAIERSRHTIEDVMFIGSSDGKYRMTMDKFLQVSDFEYDDGYGSPKIAQDLIIYFKDKTYITREEYDGSEWWQINNVNVYSEDDDYVDFDKLKVNPRQIGWKTVEEINEEEEDE